MNTLKFLEEIDILEKKLRKKNKDSSLNLNYSELINQMYKNKQLKKDIFLDLKKIWFVRNKIYSSTLNDREVSDEAQSILAKIISNSDLK